MATLNISLPEQMKAYISQRVSGGEFSNISDYVRTLIRREQEQERQRIDLHQWELTQQQAKRTFLAAINEPAPQDMASLSDDEIMEMVRDEIKAGRNNQ